MIYSPRHRRLTNANVEIKTAYWNNAVAEKTSIKNNLINKPRGWFYEFRVIAKHLRAGILAVVKTTVWLLA